MTPLPGALGGRELVAWRLDHKTFAATWDSGEGAFRHGGRWNSKGVRAVYCSVDPATAILEVAAHVGFKALDTVPHVLTSVTIGEPSRVHVAEPDSLPNPGWLMPGEPSAGQQEYGDALLARHKFIAVPSAVSRHSWNLIIACANSTGAYALRTQERFALDTRLHPPMAR